MTQRNSHESTPLSKIKPTLSILLPIKNGRNYLAPKIEQIQNLSKKYHEIEVLISVNISTDGTDTLLKNYMKTLPSNCQVWFQSKDLTGGQQMEFLVSRAQGTWVMFSAVDDKFSIRNVDLVLEKLRTSVEESGFTPIWKYSTNIHGEGEVVVDLSGPQEERLKKLIQVLRISHGIFYSIFQAKLLSNFTTKFGFDFIGCDWLFDLYLVMNGPMRPLNGFQIEFAVNGTSRQARTFRKQDPSFLSIVFPYWKLSFKTLFLLSQAESLKVKNIIILFSFSLLVANLRRHFNNLVDYSFRPKIID